MMKKDKTNEEIVSEKEKEKTLKNLARINLNGK